MVKKKDTEKQTNGKGTGPKRRKGDDWRPTPLQAKMVALLADITDRRSIEEKCKVAGIHKATYYRWRKEEPEFVKYLEETMAEGCKSYIMMEIPSVMAAVVRSAKMGKGFQQKMLLEIAGLIRPPQVIAAEINNQIKAETSGPTSIKVVFNGPSQKADEDIPYLDELPKE